MNQTKRDALRQSVNNLIQQYGNDHPELVQDLLELRDELDASSKRGPLDYANYAVIALRIAHLAEWIYHHLPPPH